MKKNAGFTLIELVIVIIVLGILAATAVPKFINLQDDAKASAMKGVEAALNSAANIVYSKAAIDGIETAAETAGKAVSAAGATINIAYGYPTADANGIAKAVDLTGFAPQKNVVSGIIFTSVNDTAAGDLCVSYVAATGVSVPYKLVSGELGEDAKTCTAVSGTN